MILNTLAVGAFLLLPVQAASEIAAAFDPNEFLVKGLEDIEPAFATFKGQMYAGLLPFHLSPDREAGEFMFWLFQPDEPEVPDSLSIYISGGPGCSSIGTGNVFGSGPVTVPKFPAGMVDPTDKDDPFVPNPDSWVVATNLLYIEQPASTGFSYGTLPNDEDDVSRDVYNFLINFFSTFQHMKEKELFIWGGSYSGMMVPAISRKIHHENKKRKNHMHMNLVGIGLGNAWLDPNIQAPAAVDFAWSHGMIDIPTRDYFHKSWNECRRGKSVDPPMHPFDMPDECGLDEIIMEASGEGLFDDQAPNCYDISTWDPYFILDNDGTINKFYNNPDVQKALHARPIKWYGCVSDGNLLKYDKPDSVVPYVAELLDEARLRVLFFNGDRDLLCCHTGTETMLDSMKWSNTSEWKRARRGVWMVDNRVAGYTKSLGNLEFVIAYNSGHMMSHNQPVRSLDMVKRFLKGKSLLDVELPSYPHVHDGKGMFQGHAALQFVIFILAAVLIIYFVALLLAWRHDKHVSKRRQLYEELPSSTDNSETTSNDNELAF